MTRYSRTMTEALQEIREGFSAKQIKMAIGIASDKRYAGGNMTGAVDAIEKIKKGLSDHPQVAAVLKRQNEDLEEELELTEAKISKDMAIKILSMRKDKKFVKASGDLVPKIYLSGMDRDALKKEFGKLPRGLPDATSGMTVVSMINFALGSKDGRDPIDTEDGDSQSPKLISWNRGGKVIGKPKTVGDAIKIAGVRMESVELDEEVEIDEMKMNDPKLNKIFDKLKKGDTVKLKTSSTINQGKDFVEYIVKSKNTVNKGRVEKITLVTKGNEKAVKKFLYKRDGQVTFAIGDMGASIDDIKEAAHTLAEKLKVSDGVGAWIKDFQKSDAPQFQGKSEEDRKKMALAAFADAGGKLEETELDEGRMKELHGYIEKGMSAQEIAKKMKLDVKTIKSLMDETELDEAVKYQFVAIDRLGKVIGFASDEKDAKDMAQRGHTMDSPSKGKGVVGRNKAKVVKLKKPMSDKQGDMMINRDFDMNKFGGETTYSVGLKEEDKPDNRPDSAKAVDQSRDDKKKTRIAQLQLQIAKATETINKLNTQEKPDA
jgi:hypothetical protein